MADRPLNEKGNVKNRVRLAAQLWLGALPERRCEDYRAGSDRTAWGCGYPLARIPVRFPSRSIKPLDPFAALDRLDAVAGGLVSYGPNLIDSYRILGQYTARVLKGEKPNEMPVWQTVDFELVIKLKTGKTLGIEMPAGLLAGADEVIE